MELRPGEIHLWFTFTDEVQDPQLLEAYGALMTPEEHARQKRYIRAVNRHEFLVARALVRTTLSRYAEIAPQDWAFVQNDHGRPEIAPGQRGGSSRLRFNLSHTAGLMVVAVVREHDLGVDVEHRRRKLRCMEIADRFFSPYEMRQLHALPLSEQRRRFFHYWTLKEAYIKARGKGLAIPLHQFSYHVVAGDPLRLSFDPHLKDDPSRWQLRLFEPTPHHAAALAMDLPVDAPRLSVSIFRTVPMMHEMGLPLPMLATSEQPLR